MIFRYQHLFINTCHIIGVLAQSLFKNICVGSQRNIIPTIYTHLHIERIHLNKQQIY